MLLILLRIAEREREREYFGFEFTTTDGYNIQRRAKEFKYV